MLPFTNCSNNIKFFVNCLFFALSFHFFYHQMSRTLESSPNALINKKVLDRYLTLDLPENKILATYIWIDGTDQYVRCKDRTLDFVPKTPKGKFKKCERVALLFCMLLYDVCPYVILDINAIKSSALEIDFNCVHAVYQRH